MPRVLSTYLLCATLLPLAVACGGSTQLSSTWMDDSFQARPLGHTLVIGVAQVPDNRVLFEDEFAAQLSTQGATAVASNTLMDNELELTRENVEGVLGGQDFASVLVTRVISNDTRRIYTPPAGGGQSGASAGMYDAMARSSYQSGVPGTYVEQQVVVLETGLYDVATGNLVWTAETESVDPGSLAEELEDFVAVMLAALSDAGLL